MRQADSTEKARAARFSGRRRRERRLAKPAELALVLLLASGLLTFAPFGLPWRVVSWALAAHVAGAVLLVPALILPFWQSHRFRLGFSRRRFQSLSGRVIEAALAAIFLSGGWLLFVGWNGTGIGAAAHWLHLALGLPAVLLVLAHAWRFSVLRTLLAALALVGAGGLASGPAAAPATGAAAQESRSLLLEAGGATLLSANFDAGSVSRIERATGRRLAEATLGGDITSVAVDGPDGVVAATDYSGDKVSLLAGADLSPRRTVALSGRPAGVVYDARNHLFWIAATEGNRLYALAPDGTVRLTLDSAESPRGLALLPDGRLLVSHALIGAVSIYDTTSLPPKRLKLIELAETRNPDETVSQGVPRGLDRIAVSPDLKQAWLPHMLWNFDHPFQFQSTVFPAVSVLSLAPGDEREVAARRKELFRQINIVEDGNRTRIVSNPADAAFSDDGRKVYVTMAGSEDLVVFDLGRALAIDSHSAKAKATEGAKAVQIYRHLPGAEPRGIVVTGDDIYVQNAQSLDLTRATTGGAGAFAEVSVLAPSFARLVARDPMAPELRRGARLFNLANSAIFPDAPMTGDNWMSCSSCHLDGFNFSNRALFKATPVDKFHSAVTGHGSIARLVAGDFIGDYIRMVQDTQGGMGADTRFPVPVTDPDKPSPEVAAMMRDLHAYVTSPGNLPLLATWLRGTDGGASVDPEAWTNSVICAGCHAEIARQWSSSLHHFAAGSDPYYVVLEDLAAQDVGEGFRAWCMGCHAPQAILSGETRTTAPDPLFRDGRMADGGTAALDADLAMHAHAVDEGTSCLFCHRVTKIEESGGAAGGNASLDVSPADRPTYPFETSDSAILRAFGERLIRARPEVHATSLMANITGDGANRLCAACHEEFAPGTGAYIVNTWQEWAASPYNAPDDPAANRTCLDCHMHASVESIGKDVPGRATDGGPLQANVVSHSFVGAQYHLAGLRNPAAAAESVALLRRAAGLSARVENGALLVRIENTGAGHDLPTGVSDFRQMWLDITVTDASGRVVLRSGALDGAGRLDPAARLFQKAFDDRSAHAVALRFWQLARYSADTRIPAGGHRDESFALPADTRWPVTAEVRLMFRTFPQWVTDKVLERFPDMPPPDPVEMARLTATLGQD